MSIQMIGIDHTLAEVDVRSLFSFTQKGAVRAMDRLKNTEGIEGCVILSTCNRMEVWVNVKKDWTGNLYEELCKLKGVNHTLFPEAFVRREGVEAVSHLFRLSSGMKSLILGEDQILTQVKDALSLARENDYADSVLEVLFRMAVTAGKQVKTQVAFPHGSESAVERAVESLKSGGGSIEGKHCMVIGNGQMGLLAARAFADAGAEVFLTVRRYHHGEVSVPEGCRRIDYEERASYLKHCDFLVSATASPHCTLNRETFLEHGYKPGLVAVDLAVPRDLDENIRELDGVVLFDIDDFKSEAGDDKINRAMNQADTIIGRQIAEFDCWMTGKNLVPQIQMIREEAAEDVVLRLGKRIRKTALGEREQEDLKKSIEGAAGKVVNKMLFGLKEYLCPEEFQRCVKGLEQLYGEK